MCRVTMGHLRVTIGHLKVTVGHLRVPVGHFGVPMGHLRLTIGYLKATEVHIRVTLGHLRLTIGNFFLFCSISFVKITEVKHKYSFLSLGKQKENTTELHPKVRPTCSTFCLNTSKYSILLKCILCR